MSRLDERIEERLERRRREREAAERSGDAESERLKIVVVDDEAGIRKTVWRLLRRDYDVLTAESGREALELLRENDVAVLLTDQRMPGMTGTELLTRAYEERPETSRILFTGYSDIQAVIDAINEGRVLHYVAKPWDPEELLSVVERGVADYEAAVRAEGCWEVRRSRDRLGERVRELTEEVERKNEELARLKEAAQPGSSETAG